MSQRQTDTKPDALKNLHQQAAYVTSLQQKKTQIKSTEIQKLLSHSIQKAKEKLQNVTSAGESNSKMSYNMSKGGAENVNTMNYESGNKLIGNYPVKPIDSGVTSSAVASALKCLQAKVATLESQGKEGRETIGKLEEENKRLVQNQSVMQESKSELEIEIVELKAEIQGLMKKIKETENAKEKRVLSQQQGKKNQSLKIQQQLAVKQKELISKYEKKERQLEVSQKQIDKKVQQMSALEKDLVSRQKSLLQRDKERQKQIQMLRQKQRAHQFEKEKQREKEKQKQSDGSRQLYRMHQKYKQLLEQNSQLERKFQHSKTEIFKLQTQIQILRQSRQNSNEQQYIAKIQRLEEDIRKLKDKNKYETKIEALKHQNRKMFEELQTLTNKHARLQHRYKDEQKQTKFFKNKYQEVKDVLNELTGKIKKLPSGVSQQFKFILVKISKLDKEGNRSDRSYSKINFSDTKSDRIRSNSKSVKSTKKKPLKLQDLDKSRQSSKSISKSRSISKQKRVIFNNPKVTKIDNTYLKSSPLKSSRKRSSSVSKTHHLPHSNTSLTSINISQKELRLSTDMNELEKIILNIKKEYKLLAGKLNDSLEGDDPEMLRERLNQLNEDLQSKTEQMADLRIKFRNI